RQTASLPYLARRFLSFQGVATRHESSSEKVGQTGSLPSLPERPHRRSQGKLPVCPTSRGDFYPFRAAQRDMKAPPKRLGKLAVCPVFPKDRIEGVKANCQFALPRAAIFILSGRRNAT